MKGVLGVVLLIISVSTLIVFGISKFVQPILPPFINSTLLLIVASFIGVLGVLAMLNDSVELVQKIFSKQNNKLSNEGISEKSLSIYHHHNPPYNAAKILYTGTEIAKDLVVRIEYNDSTGNPQTKIVTDFFPKNDQKMIWFIFKYDSLEPNQVAYFRLIKRKTTSDGKALIVATFTGALSGKSVSVKQEFQLKDF